MYSDVNQDKSSNMKKLIFGLLSVILITPVAAQTNRHEFIFKPGQTKLTTDHQKKLDELARSIKDGERIRIYPLTYDSIFDEYSYSKDAKVQAAEIAEYAKTRGFELLGTPMNFPSTYRGFSVSVDLKYNKPKEVIATMASPKPYSLQNHYPPKTSQYFIIDPNRDTMIVGNEGTKIYFDAGSLLSPDKVKIELKEFYSLSDYMKNGIPTVSNGQMIQTGGSIYLNATQDNSGEQVKVNQDIGIGLDFNSGEYDPDMQIFVKDPGSPDEMNWILPAQQATQ